MDEKECIEADWVDVRSREYRGGGDRQFAMGESNVSHGI